MDTHTQNRPIPLTPPPSATLPRSPPFLPQTAVDLAEHTSRMPHESPSLTCRAVPPISPTSPTSLTSPTAPTSPTQPRSRHPPPGQLPLPPSTLLSLHSADSSHPTSPHSASHYSHSAFTTPRSAPHTPPSPVARSIPLPPVTPYDTPVHTTASSPVFSPATPGWVDRARGEGGREREVSPLRWGPVGGGLSGLGLGSWSGGAGDGSARGSSLLHLAEPVSGEVDPPADPTDDHPMDTEPPAEAPPAYSRLPGTGDLSLPPFHPPPSELIPILLPTPPPTHRPLDPPPECFSTPTPWRLRPRSFTTFRIPSLSASLAGGWEPLYAPALAAHGIREEDWARFLSDLTFAAHLSSLGQSALAPSHRSTPHPGLRTLLAGPWAVEGGPYDQTFKKSVREEVEGLVGVWNGSAWERRKVRVGLVPAVVLGGDEGGGEEERRGGWELVVEAL